MDVPVPTLTLPDGRTLAWAVYGAPLDRPTPTATMFYCHGFPGSRLEAQLLPPALLAKLGLRCIAVDRPGMGRSTHVPTRKLLDFAADVVAIADHLGVQKFHLWGVSGGVPYALACARALQATGRVLGVACVSGLYPLTLGTAGMVTANRVLMMAGTYLPRWATGFLMDSQMGKPGRDPDPQVLHRTFDKHMEGLPAVEAQVLAEVDGAKYVCVEALREAMTQGPAGSATDLMLYTNWGFELDEIDGKRVSIWHGTLDKNAPAEIAERAGKALVGAKVHILEGEGHLSTPLRHMEEMLVEMLGRGSASWDLARDGHS